jgi:hypothetical protein
VGIPGRSRRRGRSTRRGDESPGLGNNIGDARDANAEASHLHRCNIWEEVGTGDGGPYGGRLRPRQDLAVADDPESETGLFVVASDFTLADGSSLAGYCTPTPVGVVNMRGWFRGIGLLQPAIVLDHGQVPFWFRDEPERTEIQTLYDRLQCQPQQVFPVAFEARVDVPSGHIASGRLEGFYFPRHRRFTTPFAALNRTLLAERLGEVR